jgi:tetratricopeptide (TPR) repeat protein
LQDYVGAPRCESEGKMMHIRLRIHKAVIPAVTLVAAVLVAGPNLIPGGARADETLPDVFRCTPIEAFMGGGDTRSPEEPQPRFPRMWSSPAQSSQPEARDDTSTPPASVDPPLKAPMAPDDPTVPPEAQSQSQEPVTSTAPAPPSPREGEATAPDASALLKQAEELEKAGDDTAALSQFQSAAEVAESAHDQKTAASALSAAARLLHRTNRDPEALDVLNRSLAINKALKNARARSLDHLLAGKIFLSLSDHAEALKAFEESLKIMPESESIAVPDLMENMAVCYLRLDRYPEAVSSLNRGLALCMKTERRPEAARIHVVLGEIQVARSDNASARANFRKAFKLYSDAGLSAEAGETLYRIAYVDQLQGDFKASSSALEQGAALVGNSPNTAAAGLPLLVTGVAQAEAGKVFQAAADLNAALSVYEKAGDRIMAARVRLALANLDRDRASFDSALAIGGKALQEFRSLSSPAGEAAALRLIGEVYFRQGFVLKSMEYGDASLAISRKIGDRNQVARSVILLAEIHTSMGDSELTPKLLKEAVEGVKAGVDRRTKAEVRLALARYRLSRDASERSLQEATEARQEFAETNDRRNVADCDHVMGLIHELRGDRDTAFQLLGRALNEHEAMVDRYGEGRDLTALGVHYKNLGDHNKAMEYFTKSLDLRKGIGDRRGCAANLANIGNLLRHQNRIDEAIRTLEQALALFRELSDKKGEADILTNLGNAEAARGAQGIALEKFTSALALHREMQDPRGLATNLTSMGRLYLAKGDVQNASACLDEAAKANKRIQDPRGDVAVLTELAMVQGAKGNSKEALALLKTALESAGKLKDGRAISSIRLKMATVYEEAGEHAKALALLQETLAEMRRQGDRQGELWALSGIAVIQVKTEDYEKALGNLHKALQLLSELGLPASQSTDLDFYLGEIYEGFRDFEQALEHYHKALTSAQTHGNDSTLARIYDRLGNIYYLTEDYPKARDFLEDAVRINGDLRDVAMQKTQLVRLGDILSKLGDAEGALKYQQRALALTRADGDERAQARILTRMGTLYQILGKPRVALETYKEARDLRTRLGDRRGVSENHLQIALVTSNLGGFDDAVADLKRTFEISHSTEDRGMLWKAYFIMGRVLESKNSLGEALESYRKAITILEAMEADVVEESDEDTFIFGGKNTLFETTLRVLMKLARKDPEGAYDSQALRIVEKLKAAEFDTVLSRINVDKFSDLPQDLVIKEKSLKLSLRKLNARLASELSKLNPDQAQIKRMLADRRAKEQSFTELKDRLMKEYPSYAHLRYPRPISVHQLQKEVIRPEEALLAYMVTRGRAYVFAIDKNRFHAHSIEYPIQDMQTDINSLMKPLYRADTQANWDPSIAYRLYSKLIKPVEYFLAAKKTVVIIPHGPLASLPFEILVSSKAHAEKRFWSPSDKPTYLLEKYAFCYAPSASVLAHVRSRKREKQPGWSLVAFGDAVYSDSSKSKDLNPGADKLLAALSGGERGSRGPELRPLPGARREISEIVKIMGGPSQVYLGAQATETLFKKADLSRYGYLHLATHGVHLGGSGKFQHQHAILFSLYGDRDNDGFLQLGEVFGLKLNSDLVVLSSCLSSSKAALPDADGLSAMARAFLFAGTDAVVLSMWQVNDESTAKLFIEMYRNLKDGSKAEALRQAQLSLLANNATSHPYYWAPFILMGDWPVSLQPGFHKADPKDMPFQGISTWRKLLNL